MKTELDVRIERNNSDLEIWKDSLKIMNSVMKNIKKLDSEYDTQKIHPILEKISLKIGLMNSREGHLKNNHKEIPWKYLIFLEKQMEEEMAKSDGSFLNLFKNEFLNIEDHVYKMIEESEIQVINRTLFNNILHSQKEILKELDKKINQSQINLESAESELIKAQQDWQKKYKENKSIKKQGDATKNHEYIKKQLKDRHDTLLSRREQILKGKVICLSELNQKYLNCDVEIANDLKKITKQMINRLKDRKKSLATKKTLF